MLEDKNIEVFKRHGVYSENEIHARYEIFMQNYCQIIGIEALTMTSMIGREIIPAALSYQKKLSDLINSKAVIGISTITEQTILNKLANYTDSIYERLQVLESATEKRLEVVGTAERGNYYKDELLGNMNKLREVVDSLEKIMPAELWPVPTYAEMLYSVN